MTNLPKISLDNQWRYRLATADDDYATPSLDDSDWDWTTFTGLVVSEVSPPDVIWLRNKFSLDPTESCVRYFLRCDEHVYPLTIYLRGEEIYATGDDSYLDIDVTDYLSLDDNVLVLAINANQWDLDPQNAELYLQPIFCDDLA